MTSAEGWGIEHILRPLAEARERRLVPLTALGKGDPRGLALEEWEDVPDPRFEALRKHPVVHWDAENHGYRSVHWLGDLDASLGAIVRALAACGYTTLTLWLHAGCWHARLGDMRSWDGTTPEEALARALVAVWRDEKRSPSRS